MKYTGQYGTNWSFSRLLLHKIHKSQVTEILLSKINLFSQDIDPSQKLKTLPNFAVSHEKFKLLKF